MMIQGLSKYGRILMGLFGAFVGFALGIAALGFLFGVLFLIPSYLRAWFLGLVNPLVFLSIFIGFIWGFTGLRDPCFYVHNFELMGSRALEEGLRWKKNRSRSARIFQDNL